VVASLTAIAVIVGLGAISVITPGSPVVAPAGAAEPTTPALVLPTDVASPADPNGGEATPTVEPTPGVEPGIKNVVLLLADDLDTALFDAVPRLAALRGEGTSLTNFVVTDSLCCPSRTSIMRSEYVHNHRVLSNIPATGGGWETFYKRHLQRDCLPVWLQRSGVQTALVGKYLNGFPKGAPSRTYIPPGWSHFTTSISGNQSYKGYNYTLNQNGRLVRHGSAPVDFLNDVLTTDAAEYITSATEPFFLELSTYNPHVPSPIAPRNVGSHAGATMPRTPSFDARGTFEPNWLRKTPNLTSRQLANVDRKWTRRLESAESVADSYDAVVAALSASGHLQDTLIIVTSDNGYHMGQHRLASGKQTPFREDTIVPAVLIGPGIAKGATIDQMTSTIDLAPTIARALGSSVPEWTDGRDLSPLLANPTSTPWRTGVLVESLAAARPGDVDYTNFDAPTLRALRTRDWLFVEYVKGGETLYDLVHDPYEINNIASVAPSSVLDPLRAQLAALKNCSGSECRVADSLPDPAVPISPDGPTPSATATPTPTADTTASPTATVSGSTSTTGS
jgi:arylsulfatase A-like enzyme